jgi:hypothetical protein
MLNHKNRKATELAAGPVNETALQAVKLYCVLLSTINKD